MRKVALVSDIHSNLEALDAVLSRIGGEEIYCLGDVVGYGANPNEVIERLRDEGAKAVMGNHDNAVVTEDTGWFNARAAMAAHWTRSVLAAEHLGYLRELPLDVRRQFDGVNAYLTHGSPDDPLREYVSPETHSDLLPYYLSKTGSDLIALGHTHVPFVWKGEEGVVLNPGSVGQPRDGDPRAAYAVLTVDGESAEVEIVRVKYDVAAAASKIRKAGLPAQLAERLSFGR